MKNNLFNDEKLNPYLMPIEFIGQHTKNGGLTHNDPRKWTDKEIEWVIMLKNKGFTIKQISECIYRDKTQVSIKIKRLNKMNKTYNNKHIDDKYYHNELFLSIINPKNVLDLYSGAYSYYEGKIDELYTNDVNNNFNTYYSENAEKLIHKLYYENNKYDLIDLDPFGSAYECFDLAIKMAKKGVIITFGEYGHKRFKRIDFVNRYYNINNLNDFTIENIVNHVINIGKKNKKILNPIFIREWKNIFRVYFEIKKM